MFCCDRGAEPRAESPGVSSTAPARGVALAVLGPLCSAPRGAGRAQRPHQQHGALWQRRCSSLDSESLQTGGQDGYRSWAEEESKNLAAVPLGERDGSTRSLGVHGQGQGGLRTRVCGFVRLRAWRRGGRRSGRQRLPVAFRGVMAWFRNGTVTDPRLLGPSARRHHRGGRRMAFIGG